MNFRRAPVCHQCGSLNCREIQVTKTDGMFIKITGFLCEVCFANAVAVHQDLKRQFDELLELGVNKVLANEVMIERVERLRTQAPQVVR